MSELLIPKIEKKDIQPPRLQAGSSAIVLQRHGEYIKNPDAENAGSLTREASAVSR